MNRSDHAYLGAMVDGDGWIGLEVANTSQQLMHWLLERFGGKFMKRGTPKKPTHQQMFVWRAPPETFTGFQCFKIQGRQTNRYSLQVLAGFIDSEGCISLDKLRANPRKGTCHPTWRPHVSIGNNDSRIVQWVASRFGGRVQRVSDKYTRWVLRGSPALKLLRRVRRYLVVKPDQVGILLEYNKTKAPGTKTSSRVQEWRLELVRRLQAMHHGIQT